MPIRIDGDEEDTPPGDSATNAHDLLSFLLAHPEMGFTPEELAEHTTVPLTAVQETLSHLQTKGVVRTVDSYWAVSDDVAASESANVVSLRQIDEEYGDDAYGEDDVWAEEAPDLGENA